MLLEKTPVLWAVSVSGIAALVSVLPENVEKCKKNEKIRLDDREKRETLPSFFCWGFSRR